MTWFKRFQRNVRSYEIDEATIGIGNSRVSIRPNNEDMQIAYKLWVELSTRKIGLSIDLDNDVIEEIYDSWYEFSGLARELVKGIPISKIRKDKSTRELVKIAVEVLNEGIRPHLTKWQARFRKWYTSQVQDKANVKLSPQDCQRKYPEYDELTKDLLEVNSRLIKYREILEELAME